MTPFVYLYSTVVVGFLNWKHHHFLKQTVYLSYSMYGVVIFIVLSSPVYVPNLGTPCLEGTDLPNLVICSDI